ncbi:uncharacterized protein LOC127240869 isoform X2 [Andrographis paniculata]|uniref:uncharacterized protein LOC127240869 isoform X2 n=1 Tax=Andrographis paniculata TaxID=175694 RepID=UPI0021E8A18D|nr:uncharacterized protein LOC127240869 isoform X2 [Andrographis paniculata]
MPSNDIGDRVHNFFAQDNLSPGHHHSQVVEGNWSVLNSNFWVGSQGQVDQLSANSKNYNSQNADRGEAGYSLHASSGFNLTPAFLRPDFPKNLPQNEQPNLNGFIYANQFHQTRQNEANFLGMDTGSENPHLVTSRGLLTSDVLPGGSYHQTRAPDGSEASPMSFDLFGGQAQINHQQSTATLPLLHQHSGINDIDQLQQQLMIKKLQEIRMQQQHNRQLDLRQQYLSGQVPSFLKQSAGGQSALGNGTSYSDTSTYPWTVATGTSWLNNGSSSIQGSPSDLGFPSNLGQTQGTVDLLPQQADQSLYGVPVSSSRGLNINQLSQIVANRAAIPQMSISNNFQGNQPKLLPEQVGLQGEFPAAKLRFENDNMFGHSSKQSQGSAVGNMTGVQRMNSLSRNRPQKESSQEESTRPVALSQNEVALDPTEEKILFGSDDNIWAAFGKVPDATGEASNMFDNDGTNGIPSLQIGSWSALMQSAVAETSGSDMVPQEEWGGLTFQKIDGPSWSQPHSLSHNNLKKETSLADDFQKAPSALNSRPFLSSDQISNNAMALKPHRQKFQNESGQRQHNEVSQMFFPSLGEADKLSNGGPLQNSIAEGSQYRDASHPLQGDRDDKTIRFPGQTGTMERSNGWNATAAMPPEGSRVTNNDPEMLQQNSRSSHVGGFQGEVLHGSSLLKSNSVPSSTMELGNMKSRVSNPQVNQGVLSLKNTPSVDNSCNVGISDETGPQPQNSYSLNQWKNVHLSARSQSGENVGRLLNQANDPSQVLRSVSSHKKDEVARFEIENHDVKENSNESHHSNLSQPSFDGFREGGVPNSTDSRPLSQLSRKNSAPRKFQYHPMGNVGEDVKPAYDLKQPSHVHNMLQNSSHFGQSKMFRQVSRNSMQIKKGQSSELQRDVKGSDEEPLQGNCSGQMPNRQVSRTQTFDTLSNSSTPSQNMLELFNKVDHSRNHGSGMQLNSAEPSSQLPVVEKYNGFSHIQHSQSHASQGFGLQLGPPSQGLQISEHPLSSENGQGTLNSMCSKNGVADREDKGHEMVANNSVQSLPSSEEKQPEFKLNMSTIPEHGRSGNSPCKTPENVALLFGSGLPYLRSNDQHPQIARVSGQMLLNQHAESLSENASYPSGRFQQDNHTSFGSVSRNNGPNVVQERVLSGNIESRDCYQTSHHFVTPVLSQQNNSIGMLQQVVSNVPVQKQNTSARIQQISSESLEFPKPNIVESSAPSMHDHVNSQGVGEVQRLKKSTTQQVASLNTEVVPEMKNSLGKTPILKKHLDDSPSSSIMMQKDIEAFGQSLKHNSFSHQNYSLLHQMQAAKDAESDLSNRASKRTKDLENVDDVHHASSKPGQQCEPSNGDSLGSSMPADLLQRNPSQDGNVALHDALALNQDTSQSNSCNDVLTTSRVDHHQISPQMAPSWFSQYGSLKNGAMLQPYDALKVNPSRPGEQSLAPLKFSSGFHIFNSDEKRTVQPIDACQNSNNHQNLLASSIASGSVTSLKLLQLNVTDQNLGVLRSKKRKSPTLDLHPWHKEISEVSQDLVAHSMAESDWDNASHCLTGKVSDDADLIDDGSPVLRCKRRLILTTRLMQKLLHSPVAAILSADASTSYDVLVYAATRIALGDACSTVYHLSNLDVADGKNLHPSKGKISVRNGVRCNAKGDEKLMERIGKLKNGFLRLDKSASILDLRLECQDLEKYSVINRFARFHGRGQGDNPDTSSANATAASQRPIPQRYVTALPLPKNIPDGVQCLLL